MSTRLKDLFLKKPNVKIFVYSIKLTIYHTSFSTFCIHKYIYLFVYSLNPPARRLNAKMGKDYYDILGVQKDATEADVKKVTKYKKCLVIIPSLFWLLYSLRDNRAFINVIAILGLSKNGP